MVETRPPVQDSFHSLNLLAWPQKLPFCKKLAYNLNNQPRDNHAFVLLTVWQRKIDHRLDLWPVWLAQRPRRGVKTASSSFLLPSHKPHEPDPYTNKHRGHRAHQHLCHDKPQHDLKPPGRQLATSRANAVLQPSLVMMMMMGPAQHSRTTC